MGEIRIGTSGWSYPTGNGTWNGIFYPVPAGRRSTGRSPARRGRGGGGFDELRFYAEHFDTVEINSTFYRIPSVETARDWVQRTPARFEFSLKLFQKFTHPEMFRRAAGDAAADVTEKDVAEFRAAVEPLAASGKLGALLAQFPPSFKNEPGAVEYLEWLLEQFKDYMVAVELRHRSWSDQPADALKLLAEHKAAWTQIDEPKFRTSIRQTMRPNVGSFYYLRLHGRNAAQWWKHDKSEDRYNYLYSVDELEPFAQAAKSAARDVKKAYLYANNHFSAKSVANAAILRHELGQDLPGEYPPEFVERYPELKGIVKELPDLLSRTPS